MNALTKTESGALALTEAETIKVLQSSLYPGAAIESIKMVLSYCKAAGLDPMQKPVHIVPMWNSKEGRMVDVVMPGVGLYRTQASRTGRFAGQTEPEFGPMLEETIGGQRITYPEWARVTVKKLMDNGAIAEFTAKEYWLENYAVKGGKEKSIAPNAMWTKRPRGQIGKCAAAQALRLAFPEMGAQPTAEEMEGKMLQQDEMGHYEPQPDYVDPKMFLDMVPECKTDAEAAKLWADHNGKLAKQPQDHAQFKAAVIAHRTALKNASATDVQPKAVKTDAPEVTLQLVMDKLNAAKNEDALNVAGDWINALTDPAEVTQCNDRYDERMAEMQGL